jgi:uncharacterized protein (DUF1800 family)
MDRRATLAILRGKKPSEAPAPPPGPNGSLTPYTGAWTYELAAHLLRRAMFGPTYAQIKDAVTKGLNATIDQLFKDTALPAPPVNHNSTEDPNVPIGSTWINAPYIDSNNVRTYRNQSLRAWTMGLLLTEGVSAREKMTLFWHNHFAINTMNINDPKFLYNYINTLRKHAWGNFRDLIKAITIDPAMLRFLNGNQNTKGSPNENYARELMELYTLGKGELAGPGDYTTFTEQDVLAMARVLTGWRDRGHYNANPMITMGSYFIPNQHDTGSKQLSHRFNNAVITNKDDKEYLDLIDLIFQKQEVARFISRKLYRWFIYYDIDAAAEQNVIEPMAQILIANNYNIKPAIQALLKSEHFYNMLNVGPLIKNPLDFIVSAIKPLQVELPNADLAARYNGWLSLYRLSPNMQMDYYNPPDVAGWKAYYQEPAYYRIWINASTLAPRMNFTNTLIGNGFNYNGFRVKIDVLKFVKTVSDPYDPNKVIEEFAKIIFPQPLPVEQRDALKEVLLPGLPDYEWGVEYTEYLEKPNDTTLAKAIETKLRNLLKAMLTMPEFYLS